MSAPAERFVAECIAPAVGIGQAGICARSQSETLPFSTDCVN